MLSCPAKDISFFGYWVIGVTKILPTQLPVHEVETLYREEFMALVFNSLLAICCYTIFRKVSLNSFNLSDTPLELKLVVCLRTNQLYLDPDSVCLFCGIKHRNVTPTG